MANEKTENSIDYKQEIQYLKEKHMEEITYWKEKYNEELKENEILKLKWSVIEMIFAK